MFFDTSYIHVLKVYLLTVKPNILYFLCMIQVLKNSLIFLKIEEKKSTISRINYFFF